MMFEYYSDTPEGHLQKNVREAIAKDLKYFRGKRVKVTIQNHVSKRSTAQNDMFHACVRVMANELGYDFEEMKEIVKFKFLRMERVIEPTGEIVQYIGQSSKLSKTDFIGLIEGVLRFAAELGIVMPAPEQYPE